MLRKTAENSEINFSIDYNNLLVKAKIKKVPPDKILLLLPTCLQQSHCSLKITENIDNCHQCGHCMIKDMVDIQEKYKIMVRVVSGGTAARAIVQQVAPQLILAVACERELIAGIQDVGTVSVIGILNETPNGPCNQTTVNIDILKDYLVHFTNILSL